MFGEPKVNAYNCGCIIRILFLEKYRIKIEQHGAVMEGMGLAPVAARIFVYLLLSPDHKGTFEDLVNYFKVSKSAVSNALKLLASTHMIEAKTIGGGKRKRFFSVNFEIMFNEALLVSKFKIFYNMLDDIRVSRDIEDDFAGELVNVSSLYKMLLVEFPIIIERWKRSTILEGK